MAKHLVLGTGTTVNWRLPADTDIQVLEQELVSAMVQGRPVTVDVEMQDTPLTTGTLILNGRSLASAALVELPEGG